jgi:hypothetical protein
VDGETVTDTLALTEKKYQTLAEAARQIAMSQLGDGNIRLRGIRSEDILHVDQHWRKHRATYRDQAAWNWMQWLCEYRSNPRRFELAIAYGSTLCGLSLGKLNRSKSHMRIDLIEGNPDPQHPLRSRVVPITILASTEFARLVDAKEIRIVDPFPALIPYYASFGFTHMPTSSPTVKPFLYRMLTPP